MKKKKKKKNSYCPLSSTLTLPPLQGFSSRETDFHFHQFLSNFLKYPSLNFPSFYPYNIFAIYFPGNSSLLKSLFSAISNFSCLLTSTFILSLNSSTTSLAFPRSSSFFHESCSTVNPFHHTKYFTTSLIFCLFKIFSTSHSSTPSTSTGFTFSTFCPSTCSLYHTTQLTFTTRCILIEVGNCNLTALVNTTSSMMYGPIYQSTNFFTSCSLNTKSFVLNITLSFFSQLFFFLYLLVTSFLSELSLIPLLPLLVLFSPFPQIPLPSPPFFSF